mgnify:CR=1 FL=1
MAISNILRTLSDTELIVLAEEINNPNVQMDVILSQLSSKSNVSNEDLSKMPTSWLSESLSYELSLRLKIAYELFFDQLK